LIFGNYKRSNMRTLLLLGIILSAGFCYANDEAANTSVYASDAVVIAQKCTAETSVGADVCMQHNLHAAKVMDDSLAALSPDKKQPLITNCAFKTLDPGLEKGLNELIELQQECVKTKLQASNTYSAQRTVEVAPKITAVQPNPAPSAGQQVGGSQYTTLSTCITKTSDPADGSAINNSRLIGVRRELLAPKEASDVYGHRLGKRYIVYQVSVTDLSKDYQYVVHDITVNLKDVMASEGSKRCQELSGDQGDQKAACAANLPCLEPNNEHDAACLASSRRLELLRGIPEKGQDYDPRNLSLHILTGLGSVAGGVSGLTPFSDVMGSAVSVFSGAFLQAFVGIFPDHTGTQLNRLSDEAFASNSLVDKLHTKDFAIFIPQALVLEAADQKTFWSDPRALLDTVPLDLVDVCVDGSLVTEVSITPTPAFSPAGPGAAPGQTVTIQDSASDATIYYTDVDGTTPSATSEDKYTGPIALPTTLGVTKTIQAIAISPNKAQSNIVSQTYTIQKMPLITFNAATAGTNANTTLTIKPADPADAELMYYTYTTNGTTPPDPTSSSTNYTAPIPLPSSMTVKAIEVPTGTTGSTKPPVATYTYTAKK
jgi:hypothetical protein